MQSFENTKVLAESFRAADSFLFNAYLECVRMFSYAHSFLKIKNKIIN